MDLIDQYLQWFQHNKGRAERSVIKYRQSIERLQSYLTELDKTLESAQFSDLEEFTGIYAHKTLALTPRARKPLVAAIRGFYTWAAKSGHLIRNTAEELEYPKSGRRLPRAMGLGNAEKLLMQPDLDTFIGIRDAAMIGILIGCGPRVSGLCSLNQEDLQWYQDGEHKRLVIRFNEKGDKERLVPAPPETTMLIHAYLGHPEIDQIDRLLEDGTNVLFVSTQNYTVPEHEYRGEARRLRTNGVYERIRRYGEHAGIPMEELHPHALRHLFGTEMVEDDINILISQDLMGHEDPKTTQTYSRLAIRKKIEAIDKASPMRKISTPVTEMVRYLERRARKRPSESANGH